jgi:parvulin-like peptidyl-prolyl isomerase
MKRESFALGFRGTAAFVLLGLGCSPVFAADGDEVFATIGSDEITRAEFEREVYTEARQTFYHGKPPEGEEFIEFRKGVADRMIARRLLLNEAGRRGVQPDKEAIDAKIASYESRYGGTERWETEGPRMVAALREKFEEDSILELLEAQVRSVPEPDESAVRAFYDANPDLFTEPERKRVSLILLGVPPSSGTEVWAAAGDEAERILDQLAKGASFEDLATLHSADRSAAEGGDMGYLHSGMLGEDAEAVIGELDVGEVSEPVQVLEGIAIFKLTERAPSALRSFEDVRARAFALLEQEQGEVAWDGLLVELKSASEINVDGEYLVTVPPYMK